METSAETRLAIAPLFTDGMVLQRGKPLAVWGTGPEGGQVSVGLVGQSARTVVRHREWRVDLAPMEAGGPYHLEVRCDVAAAAIRIRDVLVGEVWLAAGQSNMVQPLLVTEGGVQASSRACDPGIRFFTVPRRPFPNAQVPGWDFIGTMSSDAAWQTCAPETALSFSAIGFHFADILRPALDVPVGIISCNWGATPAQAWMSERHLEQDPMLRPLLANYRLYEEKLDLTVYEQAHDRYIEAMHRLIAERGDIERKVRELGLSGYRKWVTDHPLVWPDQPYGPKHPERPCGLYDTMLCTIIPYSIRGVLWYQGENHAMRPSEASLYRHLLEGLIAGWREDWRDPSLPFLIVQLPGYEPQLDPNGDGWSLIREAQQETVARTPNTALIATLDCGECGDIHPVDKRTVAERLTLAARCVAYGEPVRFEGPRFLPVAEYHGHSAWLRFDPRGEPPTVTDGCLSGFEVCGADGIYYPAEARFAGSSDGIAVEVSCKQVPQPTAVRYAWGNMPEWSIAGMNGIPAAPQVFV